MLPDRLRLMVMALPAPRAVRLSQTWRSGLAGSGGGYLVRAASMACRSMWCWWQSQITSSGFE